MKSSAQVLLIKDGKVLVVSRKDNHSLFGLPGGKMEHADGGAPINTAFRETIEETGIVPLDLELIYAKHYDGMMSYTYLAKDFRGEIEHEEPHVVKWGSFEDLLNGSFPDYNKEVIDSYLDLNK